MADLARDQAWEKILRPKYEDEIKQVQDERLEAELQSIIEDRADVLCAAYWEEIKKRFRPAHSLLCPTTEVVRKTIPEVKPILYRERDVDVTASDFQPIMEKIIAFGPQHLESKKAAILRSIPESERSEGVDPLTLAKNVFTCDLEMKLKTYCEPCRLYITWDDMAPHIADGCFAPDGHYSRAGEPFNMRYSEAHSQQSAHLLQLVGLNPDTATVEEMDAIDARFICWCSVSRGKGLWKRDLFTWRQAGRRFIFQPEDWRLMIRSWPTIRQVEATSVNSALQVWARPMKPGKMPNQRGIEKKRTLGAVTTATLETIWTSAPLICFM